MDGAVVAEAGHGAAQLVGFGRAESGPDDGDLHRLFLEKGNAQGLPQNLAQIFRRVLHRLDAPPPAQVGMNHVPLDRPRPHDRHFDDQVVEVAGFSRGSIAIWARLSIWKTPIVSARWIIP